MPDLTPIMLGPEQRREMIRRKVLEGLQESFPMKARNKTVEVADLRYQSKDYGSDEQKQAILKGETLYESVKGTVRMRDSDNKIIDEMKDFTLVRVPFFTPRHTFILDGKEHSISNMLRRKPGVYTRKRANGILEASFNTHGGRNFRVSMDPAKGEPQLEYGSTKIPLYPILRKAGVSHAQVAQSWGKRLADQNEMNLYGKADQYVDKLYKKEVPEYRQEKDATPDGKMRQIMSSYAGAAMDPLVNQQTLGKPYSHVDQGSLLDASTKVLDIFKNTAEVDDQDNLDFKYFVSVDDLFKERIKLDAREIARKATIKMEATPDLKRAIPPGPFTKGLRQFINTSQLASIPTQTNPMELIDAAMRVTSLGEGGISTERAVPVEARQTHVTQMGALDPIRTPESFRAGIDVRAAMLAKRDDAGNIYVPVYDVKTNRHKNVRAGELQSSIVAFPNQEMTGTVDALVKGALRRVPASRIKYQIEHPSHMYSPTTNLIPFLESSQGNRGIMGSKMQVQALSLVHREAPYIQVEAPNKQSFERLMGEIINPTSPVDGEVAKIDKDYIYVRPNAVKVGAPQTQPRQALMKVPYNSNFPLAAKTYLDHKILVAKGDKVSKDQLLGDSNFTRDGILALGKNMRVAFMPYYGANSNDAVVISEDAAKKLTSERMYKITIPRDNDLTFKKTTHRTYYGHDYTKDQYEGLDDEGVVTPGSKILPGNPIVVGLRKTQLSADDLILGKLHRSLVKPFREYVKDWDHDHAGEVIDVVKTPKQIALTIKTQEPAGIGDKISGRFGNKGVVSRIIPNDQMVQDEEGRPLDILMTSAGVVSRINPSQIVETAVGKVAEKYNKTFIVPTFRGIDNVQWAKDLLKEHGVKDKETVFDPVSGKHIPKIFVGNQYIFKLFKSTDTNYSARGVPESYDLNQQPTKGGIHSAKVLGKMELDALVGYNARNILKDSASIKSQKNDEYWRAIQLGYPTPSPKTSFAYNKFLNMLTGAGIKVNRTKNLIGLAPLTDADVMEMSSGEVKDSKIVRAKDLKPEIGGLFDPAITGGLRGEKWSHISLAEPIINPVFKDPARRLLGMTNAQLSQTFKNKGGAYIKSELKKIDLDAREKELLKESDTQSASQLDDTVKKIKYIRALKASNLTPDNAYIISKVPVTPPLTRPVLPMSNGQQILYGDANPLYQDLIYINNQLKDVKKDKFLKGEEEVLRPALQEAVGAVYGMNEPVTTKSRARGHKGFLTFIAGKGSPKYGYFQSKLMRRTQDVAGRGTIVPDQTLDIDEVGLPEDMLWSMYDKFIIRRLVQSGFPAINAKKMLDDKHPAAREMMMREIKERPVLINRAPTLHRYNILAAMAKPVPGKTIRVNPFIEKSMNADYDGDCADSHLEFLIDKCYRRLHISECPHNKESRTVKGNKEVYTVPKDVKVFGYSNEKQAVVLCDVTHFSVHHDLEMVEVEAASGRKTKVSSDHSMFGLNPETGCLERTKAEESVGWGIPRPRKLVIPEQINEIALGNTEIHDSVALNLRFGWFMGAWAGDGWISHIKGRGPTTTGIATTDINIRDMFEKVAQQYVPDISARDYVNSHYFRGVKCVSKKAHLNSERFSRLFHEMTEGCRGAENKRLPTYFVQAPRDFLLGVFGGLLDTDGTVSVVSAKAKNKPQYMAHYTTLSEALADHVGILATLLGVRSNTHWYQKKKEGKWYCQVTFSTPDVARIAAEIPCVHTVKRENLDTLSRMTFDPNAPENARWDTIPIPGVIAQALRSIHGNASSKRKHMSDKETAYRRSIGNRYQKLTKAVKTGKITRQAFYDVVARLGVAAVQECAIGDWFSLAMNENIIWDYISDVIPLEGRHTAWDLTVPDGNTFMTSNQLIVFDSMMVHVPVSQGAVNEAEGMKLSNILFGDQSKSDLLVFPQHEAIMGINYASTPDDRNTPKVFKNKTDAMSAYNSGKIGVGTRVKIGS